MPKAALGTMGYGDPETAAEAPKPEHVRLTPVTESVPINPTARYPETVRTLVWP